MRNLNRLILTLFFQVFLFQQAIALDGKKALVPLPSLDDFTKNENGWAFGLGFGIEYESAYEGSDEFGLEVDPAGSLQWRSGSNIFFFAGEAIGWRGLKFENWLFETIVSVEEGRKESDSEDNHLDGLGDEDEGIEFVLQTRRAFDADWRYWLDARVITGENGNFALLALGRRFGDKIDGTGHETSLAIVFHDSEYANNDFGLTATQAANSGLKQTNMGGGFRSIGFNYNYREYLAKDWQIIGEAVYEGFSSEVQDSPITRKNFEMEVGIGIIYIF